MKTRIQNHQEAGSGLLVTLCICAVVSFAIAGYLALVQQQYSLSMRSQQWNSTIALVEAGIEEGLQHLNDDWGNLGNNWWSYSNGAYVRNRTLTNGGTYTVKIDVSQPTQPVIKCQANTTMLARGGLGAFFASIGVNAEEKVTRTVQVKTSRSGLFIKAMVAKDTIDMNGNNVLTDSFDSTDPNYSTGGQYDASKRKANGDVATNSSLTNSLNVGNANVYGRVATGPKGSVKIGPNGKVGDLAYQASGPNGTIQPGYFRDDMNFTFPDAVAPFSGNGTTPTGGSYNGVSATYILGTGNYKLSSMSLSGNAKVFVTGNAKLWVTGNFSMAGNSEIVIVNGATLDLTLGSDSTGNNSASIAGNGLLNYNQYASSVYIKGMKSLKSLSLKGNGELKGVVYAPYAALTLNGGGSGDNDFIGASVTRTVTFNGHFKFHYDEALANFGNTGRFLITAWDEIPNTSF
ncbi:MAG TPA: hypothetical protein PKA41_05705 [Verrucomicrobiota bacterium]|nr:hypothetical protein [Verrucomicrobiota bacterium]